MTPRERPAGRERLPAHSRRRGRVTVLAIALVVELALPAGAIALGSLSFPTPPALPTLPSLTLNARPQTSNATMANFSVKEPTLEGPGWNVTVAGQSGSGKSAVFAQYCPEAGGCGAHAFGYVPSGQTLPANSLTLNTTGASFSGGLGTAPTFKCSTPCNVDSATAVKIAAETAGGLGGNTWTSSGFSASSLTLTTSTLLRILPAKEVYRVNVLWTLSTGP